MNKYGFRISWSEEDQGYIATSPEFPGLSAFGETVEEALTEAKTALDLFIRDIVESGETLPEAQTVHEYSGQTRLRLSKTLHRVVAEMAASEGISLNQFVLDAINEKVGVVKAGDCFIKELRRALAENSLQRRFDLASFAWGKTHWEKTQKVTRSRQIVKRALTEIDTVGYMPANFDKGN